MNPVASPATARDLATIADLYRGLAAEMAALRPMWPLADGLAEPALATLEALLGDRSWHLYVGSLDDVIVGFLIGCDEPLLPQAGGAVVGSIRFIYTHPDAREVGVGEALVARFLGDAAGRGIDRFDAHVSPGHREAKNFFESHGFKARSIVMHRDGA